MNSFTSWHLESAKKKLENVNSSAMDFFAEEN